MKALLLLNLSAGYLNLGCDEEAGRMLSAVSSYSKLDAVYEFMLHNNSMAFYLSTQNFEAAVISLKKMNEVMQSPKFSRYLKEYQDYPVEKLHLLNMAKGNYEGSVQCFERAHEKARILLSKVFAKHTLGKAYLHYERNDEAIEAFEYVVKHGGTTRFVKEAAEQLESMGKEVAHLLQGRTVPYAEIRQSVVADAQLMEHKIVSSPNVQRPAVDAFGMTMRDRKKYVITILAVFSAIFFGSIGYIIWTDLAAGYTIDLSFVIVVFIIGFMNWIFTSLFGGMWLGYKYITNRMNLSFFPACLLFAITLSISWTVGLFVTIPYAIYNLFRWRKLSMQQMLDREIT